MALKTAAAHYDSHLGRIYAWMLGDFDTALQRSAAELSDLALPAGLGETAVDLGAGLGLHALALAERGFKVIAIDACRILLDELESRRGQLPITPVVADFLAFRQLVKHEVSAILCMGDTLTHLLDFSAVEALFESVAQALAQGGVFVTTFRDYATKMLTGDARFIPVRADEQRILTCFIEYQEQRVTVHDLLHERGAAGWQQSVSSYPKLRLAPQWVAAKLFEQGLAVRRDSLQNGMVRVVATKTSG
jgi:SAM-dependent methyltransferase